MCKSKYVEVRVKKQSSWKTLCKKEENYSTTIIKRIKLVVIPESKLFQTRADHCAFAQILFLSTIATNRKSQWSQKQTKS